MARRSLKERGTRSINKLGNGSYSITLPVEYIRALKWQKRQKVTVGIDARMKRIVIKDWKGPGQK